MAFDLDRAVCRVERQTGCEVEITRDGEGMPYALMAVDPELGGRVFARGLGTRSRWEGALKGLHSEIYLARGKSKFEQQKGLCALCGQPMKGTENTEIDHYKTRGAHGRDDRLANLRVVHGDPCHRRRHGG